MNHFIRSPFLALILLACVSFSSTATDFCLSDIFSPFFASSAVPGPNRAPVVDAGADIETLAEETIVLDGGSSYDPDGDQLAYYWRVVVAPSALTEAQSRLTDNWSTRAHLTPDVSGAWVLRLKVSDGEYERQDIVQVIVKKPSAEPDIEVLELSSQGLFREKLHRLQIKIRNHGPVYEGPLDITLTAMDRLDNPRVGFQKKMKLDVYLPAAGNAWLTLAKDEIEWPVDVPQVVFGVVVDPNIEEADTSNNSKQITHYRRHLVRVIRAKEPSEHPDIELVEIVPEGIYQNTKVSNLKLKIRNHGPAYSGSLDIKMAAMDKLDKPNVSFGRNKKIDVFLPQAEDTWITLAGHETDMAWAADVCTVNIGVSISSDIDEVDSQNNYKNAIKFRGDLLKKHCRARVTEVKFSEPFSYRWHDAMSEEIILPWHEADMFWEVLNCCSEVGSLEYGILVEDRERPLWKGTMEIKPGEPKSQILTRLDLFPFAVPEHKAFAIVQYHSDGKGYDVLYRVKLRIDPDLSKVKVKGKPCW